MRNDMKGDYLAPEVILIHHAALDLKFQHNRYMLLGYWLLGDTFH